MLLLLYAGRRGELRVVVTMRSASLRSFSGHAALPGGKADSLSETPYEIARREAWEEIGLPLDEEEEDEDGKARKTTSGGRRLRGVKGFSIEHLCDLPHHLARTDLVVRPCVAFLHVDGKPDDESAADGNGEGSNKRDASSNRTSTMMPRLDAREVAAVFSAPFHNFLRIDDEQDEAPGALSTSRAAAEGDNATSNGSGTGPEQQQRQLQEAPLPPGPWYEGYWMTATGTPWRVHFFHVPVNTQRVAKPKASNQSTGGNEGTVSRTDTETETVIEPGRYKIWGMTAHVLVDAARIAYDEQPEMECNPHLGDEELILKAAAEGRLATETGSSAATVAVGGKGTSGKKKRPAGAPGEGTGSPGSKHSRTKI